MKIITAGSIAYDYIMSFPGRFSEHFLADKLDRISVSFLVDSLRIERGGVAANIAYNLALLGERATLFGAVGKDFQEYRSVLEEAGVDASGARTFDEEFTSSCFINTDTSENQIVAFYPGAMRFAGQLSLKDVIHEEPSLVVISPCDPEAMIQWAKECRSQKVPFIFDPSQQTVSLSGEALMEGAREARMLILNEYELELFRKKTGLKDDGLLGLAETVVVTLGGQGSEIRTKEETIRIPVVPPERVVDPTGVGDAYRAGLLKGMVHGLPWEAAGRMGSLAASYVLEVGGTQCHSYNLETYVQRYCRVFGEDGQVRRLLGT